jgi:MFS family permease
MDWSKLTTSLTPLRAREFRLLFTAQTTSVVGDNFTTVALAFAVLDLTGSAADLDVVLAARTVPLVVFVLAGGVWADRLPRQRLMLGANLARFASQGLLATLLVTGHTRLWQIVALMAAHGTAGAFFYPASSEASLGPPSTRTT